MPVDRTLAIAPALQILNLSNKAGASYNAVAPRRYSAPPKGARVIPPTTKQPERAEVIARPGGRQVQIIQALFHPGRGCLHLTRPVIS